MNWKNLADRMTRTALRTFSDNAGDTPSVIYVRGGVQTPLRDAVFDENYQSVDPDTGAAIISDNPMVGVMLSDLPGGAWQDGDTVIVHGVTYRAIEPQKDSEGHAKIILHRKS